MKRKSFTPMGIMGLALILLFLAIGMSGRAHATAGIEPQTDNKIQVDPQLLAQIERDGSASYLIYFEDDVDLSPAYSMDWEARGHFVVDTLRAAAEASQRDVRTYLDSQGVAYQHFWIDNVIAVEASNITVLNGLLSFPTIDRISADPETSLIEPEEASLEDSGPSLFTVEPNLVQVKAPDVWAMGFRGQGMVVANIDSGVRYTHQALVSQYRGNLGSGSFNHNYSWLDPAGSTTSPTDVNGHGTHVMGTMVGNDGGANEIGVAPESEWIACRACLTSSCSGPALLACAEWVTAPYPIGNPGSPDPNMRPHVVNNSWGDCEQSYDSWYQGVVDAWHAAGVYPIFANGNASNCGYSSPPGLNTVGNPARYGNVTGVGSSGTSNGLYAPHSNWGPTDNPDTVNPQPGFANLKPQVIAPGVSIRSSLNSGNTAYGSAGWTGTSMSAPHVTGMIALIWQAAPCLVGDYATTETIIEQTATPVPYNSGGNPPPGPGNVPNYATGWGEINILAAVEEAQVICGETAQVTGTVQSQGYCDANPFAISGAEVVASSGADSWTVYTNANGNYSLLLDESYSPVDISVTAPEYEDGLAEAVSITTGETATVNFELRWLQPCLDVDPSTIDGTAPSGASVTHTLTLNNNGAGDLNWSIDEAEAESPATSQATNGATATGLESALRTPLPARVTPAAGSLDVIDYTIAPMADVILDGSFEAGSPNPYWDEGSLNFSTVLCTLSCGGPGPRTGNWYAWFGGTNDLETGYVRQTVTLAKGTAELSFWLWIGSNNGAGNDFLEVSIDGDVLFTATDADRDSYATYTQVVIDVSDYADGGEHLLSFDSTKFAGPITNFFVDDIVLDSEEAHACSTTTDVPWLSVAPDSGTTVPGSSDDVTVTLDGTGLAPGVYSANLCVSSNDPANPLVIVPVEMTVEEAQYGVELAPATAALSGAPGEMVTYELTVTNNGNAQDTFSFSATGGTWDVGLPDDITLAAGDSADVSVTVAIPATAADGDEDTVTITATSQGDSSATAASTLTTTAVTEPPVDPEPFASYLPIIIQP